MKSWLFRGYAGIVIEKPLVTLCLLGLLVAFFAWYIPEFKLDASADSLVLENDEALKYYRSVRETYGSDDFLVITFRPTEDILSDASLTTIAALQADLQKLDGVQSILSILNVPLISSPKVSLSELSERVRTLETPGVNKELAREEFRTSPIYSNNLVSADGRTTALQVVFERDHKYFSLLERRNSLREKKEAGGLTPDETVQLKQASLEFKEYLALKTAAEEVRVESVRSIMDAYRSKAQLFVGGASMITSDMIRFIRSDLVMFGLGVLVFLVLALWFFFRKIQWVLLPLACCSLTVVVMIGLLGFLDWRATVISSNFVSLLLINTMSITIHLIVRYRILALQHPSFTQALLVRETVRMTGVPCFYTTVTTIVAFCSLMVSGIRPVIDFGWMMTIGLAVAFGLNFSFFPALLALLRPERVGEEKDRTRAITARVARLTLEHPMGLILGSVMLAVIVGIGIPQLNVENRFIDHFKSTTEIYQGMELIDTELGGTIPFEVLIDADQAYLDRQKELDQAEDEFEDPFAEEHESGGESFWFNQKMLGKAEKVHDYLEGLPEVGKVLSIATGTKVFRLLNDGTIPDDYDLAVMRKVIPEEVKSAMINPYLSEDGNQARFTMRLIESTPNLKRKELLEQIRQHIVDDMHFPEETVHVSGLAVLYNNLLQSLYRSQILTLGFVFLSILVMFILLFRNIRLALLAIIPNLLAAGLILGLMGWVGIPLDLMTITIAAIVIGIAVDDAIHYVHRFQVEFPQLREYPATIHACHGSIGRAMYYTSLTITFGFSILMLSNFIPTIYFGLLVGLAMLVALIGNLSLLPALILLVRPLKPERDEAPLPTPL